MGSHCIVSHMAVKKTKIVHPSWQKTIINQLQQQQPKQSVFCCILGIAVSVKTHQAARRILNNIQEKITELITEGVLDNTEAEKLNQVNFSSHQIWDHGGRFCTLLILLVMVWSDSVAEWVERLSPVLGILGNSGLTGPNPGRIKPVT